VASRRACPSSYTSSFCCKCQLLDLFVVVIFWLGKGHTRVATVFTTITMFLSTILQSRRHHQGSQAWRSGEDAAIVLPCLTSRTTLVGSTLNHDIDPSTLAVVMCLPSPPPLDHCIHRLVLVQHDKQRASSTSTAVDASCSSPSSPIRHLSPIHTFLACPPSPPTHPPNWPARLAGTVPRLTTSTIASNFGHFTKQEKQITLPFAL
jgi:hypothetical protein